MQITDIKSAGCSNTLMWAIKNGADILQDHQLQSIINGELYYHVTISDVNFLELFRLTQMYREKVRIVELKRIDIPPRKEVVQMFNGSFAPNPEKPEERMPLYEAVEHSLNHFMSLAMQMSSDSDIISSEVVQMFFPMLTRRVDVQIPVSFMDMVNTIQKPEEAARIFTEDYPNTIRTEIVENPDSSVLMMLKLSFVKGTSINRYNQKYDQYIKAIKYSPLRSVKTNKLCKFALSGFYKYDNIGRGEVRCSMFMPNKDEFSKNLVRLGSINTPMRIEFVTQIPIHYMQMIENSFTWDELPISYESSMSDIIDTGLEFHDFITYQYDKETADEETIANATERENSISAYRTRIAEANQICMNAMAIILNDQEDDIDITAAFAMLPSIYTSKAIITLKTEYAERYTKFFDPVVAKMFQDMLGYANVISADIQKSKRL